MFFNPNFHFGPWVQCRVLCSTPRLRGGCRITAAERSACLTAFKICSSAQTTQNEPVSVLGRVTAIRPASFTIVTIDYSHCLEMVFRSNEALINCLTAAFGMANSGVFGMGHRIVFKDVKSRIANRQSLCMDLTILETLLVSQRTFRSLQQLKVD